MKKLNGLFLGLILLSLHSYCFALENKTNTQEQRLTPQAALNRLMEGNARYMKDEMTCPERNQIRRSAIVAKQKPFAIVLGCSDSRVPPEFVFDQGLGDIFVVRIAGNVVSALETDSIEYSAIYNDSSIIIVLGHQNCGAVDAVMQNKTKDIESVADLIKPAVDATNKRHETLEEAVKANVHNSVARVKSSEPISKLIQAGKIDVVGAYYNLETGEVTLVK